jgi:hypothetical protein
VRSAAAPLLLAMALCLVGAAASGFFESPRLFARHTVVRRVLAGVHPVPQLVDALAEVRR